METLSVHRILDLFHECRRSGQWAQCFLETRGSAITAAFSVRFENRKFEEKVEGKPRRRITPSRRRRNLQRRKSWLERKQGNNVQPCASNPAEEHSENNDEGVDDNKTKESDKGPVWKVDSIPQLDGNSEPLENSVVKEPELIEKIRVFHLDPQFDIDDTEDNIS